MGRKLNTTTLIEGVVYEAGTDEADIVGADTVSAGVWAGESDHVDVPKVSEVSGMMSSAEVAALRERYDTDLAERDETIAALTAELKRLTASSPDGPVAAADYYSALDIDALKAEIDRRNEGRDDADRIGKRGSVETLIAALEADDANPSKD